jgi:PTH1 family peptidyl-tRNA hydrolase
MTDLAGAPNLVIPQLIVGLGNPGAKYEATRHNIGFAAIDELSKLWHIPVTEHRKFHGVYGEGLLYGQKVRLLKPTTYMNRSGQAVRAVVDWFKLSPQEVLIVYDEMDLPLGKIRVRLSGSAGGHNGMKSIIAHLGTQEFPRLRIGISSPRDQANGANPDAVSHVLGQFAKSEAALLPEVLQLVQDCLTLSLKQGIEKAMSLYNSRTIPSLE